MKAKITALTRSTTSEQVAQILREGIVAGQFPMGSRLNEVELAERVGVSRGPVREALHLLAGEGLVVYQPYQGAVVVQLSIADIEELYSLRAVLEGLAVRRFAARATLEEIHALQHLESARRNASHHREERVRAVDTGMQFHEFLCMHSGHRRLLRDWRALRSQIALATYLYNTEYAASVKESSVDHDAIMTALLDHNTEQAEKLIHRHIVKVGERLLAVIH